MIKENTRKLLTEHIVKIVVAGLINSKKTGCSFVVIAY